MKEETLAKQVFLSHTRKDEPIADAIANVLMNQGLSVWDDKIVTPGGDLAKEIKKALNKCDSMIALLNQHSFSSSWVRNQLQHAFFDERYKNRLLPVLIGGSEDANFIRLPWIVTKLPYLLVSDEKAPEIIAREVVKAFLELLKSQSIDQ